MSIPYRAPNKRLIQRSTNGRFRRSTLADIGIDPRTINHEGLRQCNICGQQWAPLLVNGICPTCGAASSKAVEK